MPIRSIIFWIHLAAGLTAGAVIFIMSATGIVTAFEEEILAWRDRNVSRVEGVASPDRPALTLAELERRIEGERPGFQVVSATVFRDPQRAWEFRFDDGTLLYVDPHTGAARESVAHATPEALHTLEEWHRWLGARDGLTSSGRLVIGVCNVALVALCVTGLYLWFPRKWSWRSVRSFLVPKRGAKGKTWDFNCHVVFGFWSLQVLLALAATAVVISSSGGTAWCLRWPARRLRSRGTTA